MRKPSVERKRNVAINLGQINKYLCESDDSEYSNDSKIIKVVKNILTVMKVSFKVMKDVKDLWQITTWPAGTRRT
jgi:hypothetical protein